MPFAADHLTAVSVSPRAFSNASSTHSTCPVLSIGSDNLWIGHFIVIVLFDVFNSILSLLHDYVSGLELIFETSTPSLVSPLRHSRPQQHQTHSLHEFYSTFSKHVLQPQASNLSNESGALSGKSGAIVSRTCDARGNISGRSHCLKMARTRRRLPIKAG